MTPHRSRPYVFPTSILTVLIYSLSIAPLFSADSSITLHPFGRDSTRETQWLARAKTKLNILTNADPESIRESEGGKSLKAILQEASAAYVKTDVPQARTLIERAFTLMASRAPYLALEDNYIEAASLLALLAIGTNNDFVLPAESKALIGNRNFLERLPSRERAKVAEVKSSNAKISADQLQLPKNTRVFVFGKPAAWPLQLSVGRHLIHTLENNSVVSSWVDVEAEGGAPKVQRSKIWEAATWEALPIANWKQALLVTWPTDLARSELRVELKPDGAEAKTIILISSNEHHNAKLLPNATSPSDSKNPLATQIANPDSGWKEWKDNDEPAAPKSTILTSPWFWIAVGVVAGGAGYLIYDNTKSSKTVTTP